MQGEIENVCGSRETVNGLRCGVYVGLISNERTLSMSGGFEDCGELLNFG